MKKLMTLTIFGLGVAVMPFSAVQAADDDADVTMQVIQHDLPDAVTNQISLPDAVPEAVREAGHADSGLETANNAREHRLDGLDAAEQAIENKRDDLSTENEAPETPEVPDNASVPATIPH